MSHFKDNKEKAVYIDHFLKALVNSSFAIPLSIGLELKPLPKKENIEKYRELEGILEELDLVELVRGRDNSTLNGQCEYWISTKGKKMVNEGVSSITLLEKKDPLEFLFDEKAWEEYDNSQIEKRLKEADFFIDLIVSENLLNLDKQTVAKYFKQWYTENVDFDLQFKDGDLAIEDGDLQTIPDFSRDDISNFLNWFENEKKSFVKFLSSKGVKTNSKKEKLNNMAEKEVFVTYSWDSEEHNDKVTSLTDHLRKKGFEAENDKFHAQKESATDFYKMMHQIMTDYQKVIIVLSKGYKEKAEQFKGGVGTEYNLIIKDIENSPNKYILVSFEKVTDDIAPLALQGRQILDLSNEENFNELYAKLKDEAIIEFSEVAKEKPIIKKKDIKPFIVESTLGITVKLVPNMNFNISSGHLGHLITDIDYDLQIEITNNNSNVLEGYSLEIGYSLNSLGTGIDGVVSDDGYKTICYDDNPKIFPNQSKAIKISNMAIKHTNAEEILSKPMKINIYSDLGLTSSEIDLRDVLYFKKDYSLVKLTVESFADKNQR
ncbi:MAG: hypothetical protein ACI8ZM_005693 [Crocinitomix sp.]|jgi:hypothetical protein